MKKTALNLLTGFLGVFAFALPVYLAVTHDLSPGARYLYAHGQTGATGPTGPTGAKGSTGAGAATGSFVVNGVTLFATSAPTISNCGIGPTAGTGATNNSGVINIGKDSKNNLGTVIPVLQCTLTWATAFTNPPGVSANIGYTSGSGRVSGVGNISVTLTSSTASSVTFYFSDNATLATLTYTAF